MLIIPAIDIMDGRCVRLLRGDPQQSKVYFEDPLTAARSLKEGSAELIHIVDLDAALGIGENLQIITDILDQIPVNFQIGGGIRSLDKITAFIELGLHRVILGSAAVENPNLVSKAIDTYGSSRIAVAIDERDNKVTLHGWQESSATHYLALARLYEAMKVGAIIFTCTTVDGTLKGPQIEKIRKLVETVETPVIASGGVASLEDLTMLVNSGVDGVIIGTALYERKFTLEEAQRVVNNAC